jgi:outer membrane protein OmpA-like peptidoglycan-associated protein
MRARRYWPCRPQALAALAQVLLLALASAAADAQAPAPAAPRVPLCAGLTVVTAISQRDGDYESIKTIESVTPAAVRLKYSSERMVSDIFSTDPPKLEKTVTYRSVLAKDLASSNSYLQQFYDKLPEEIAGTTAIGTSAAVLQALETKGEAVLGIFGTMSGEPSPRRDTHPNIFDYRLEAKLRRAEPKPVMVPLVVNGERVSLPAIHARGDYFGDKTEFFFLDDPANPLTLRFRFGIDAVDVAADPDAATSKPSKRDRDSLEVVKISYHCSGQPSALEQALAGSGKAEVYDIFFTFASDQIRAESEPSLVEIAEVLKRHPDWKLRVEGHTDNVGGAQYNQALSQSRAAAVRNALVARYQIAAGRLTTAGFGDTRPRDSNDTLEGRARNRRVELVRQ